MVYMAPEYVQYGIISAKTDMFAFGMVLLELLTGLQPNEHVRVAVWVCEEHMKSISRACEECA